MTNVSEAVGAIPSLARQLETRCAQECSLERVAQDLADLLHRTFEPSVVLARVFATALRSELPEELQRFADARASERGVEAPLPDDTLTLVLLGTSGEEERWRSRKTSAGHAAIPLVSASFVHSIPMIARLLQELGLPLEWIDREDARSISEAMGRTSGIFYVEDAAKATDHQGRKIITAQDFVEEHGIRTVFGFGGAQLASPTAIVTVLFTRSRVPRQVAELFIALANALKRGTADRVRDRRLFG